jgi:acyl-CoA thioesterase-1
MLSTMKCFIKNLALLLCCVLLACSSETAQLGHLPNDAVILAMGDSITFGSGAGDGESYPAVLERLTGRQVINAGIPGELSSGGAARLPALLDEHQPQLLILCHGGNDILRRKPKQALVNNLRSMIESARQRGIDVLLVGVPEFSLLLLDSADFYAELAEEYNIVAELEILPEIESDERLKADRVHPNGSGYRKLAESLYSTLREHGAF